MASRGYWACDAETRGLVCVPPRLGRIRGAFPKKSAGSAHPDREPGRHKGHQMVWRCHNAAEYTAELPAQPVVTSKKWPLGSRKYTRPLPPSGSELWPLVGSSGSL